MPIVAFTGNIGTGKTLEASKYAYLLHRGTGVPVSANYGLRFAHRLWSLNDLYAARSGVVVLDEAQTILDSRAFARQSVRDVTQFLAQTRKFFLHLVLVTQYIHQLDKRARGYVDSLVICRKRGQRGHYRTQLDFYVPAVVVEDTFVKVGSKSLPHHRFWYSLYDTFEEVTVLS